MTVTGDVPALLAEILKLTRERDEARAELEEAKRLSAAGSELVAAIIANAARFGESSKGEP